MALRVRDLAPVPAALSGVACPATRRDNLEIRWRHVPLLSDAETARSSADLGGRVAELLDTEQETLGVNSGKV